MAVWTTLARRLLASVVAAALRGGLRRAMASRARGPRRGPSGGARDGSVTVIDVQPVGFFDRYSEAAARVVVRAAEVAGELGHAELEASHLLLALAEGPGAVATALDAQGLVPRTLRARLSRGSAASERDRPPLSAGARRVLADARHRADARSSFDVEPRDVLVALADADDPGLTELVGEAAPRGREALRRAAAAV